jgi:hypothetical protein
MPQTVAEHDRAAAIAALAEDHGVPTPLTTSQRHWLGELIPFLPTVPARMHGGLIRYILCGVPTGDFLRALLGNDLIEAVVRADDGNRFAVPAWIVLLCNAAPPPCFGSGGQVARWIAQGGLLEAGAEA